MTGTKATTLERFANGRGQAFLRFDYLGHGESSGAFTEGTIGRWAEDATLRVSVSSPWISRSALLLALCCHGCHEAPLWAASSAANMGTISRITSLIVVV